MKISKRKKLITKIKNRYTFVHTSNDDIEYMVSLTEFKCFKKNQYIYMQNEKIDFFYIIYSGRVEILKYTDKDSKKLMATLSEGDEFGVPELFETSNQHLTNALCIEDTEVALISKKEFFEKIMNKFSILKSFMFNFAFMLNELHKYISITKPEEKMLALLNIYIEKKAVFKKNELFIKRIIPDSKIGEILDLTRETINRTFKKFEKQKIIKIEKDKIIILDRKYIEDNTQLDFINGIKGLIDN